MSNHAGPEIANNDLILSLDASNIKSFPYHPGTTDHGISEWYCFVSGTATYSCSEANTTIYQITAAGVITTAVASSANPQGGFMTVTADCRYYGDKPIFLTVEDQHHAIVPLTMSSTLFIYVSNRGGSELGTFYFYAPFGPATVTMYTAGTGINGTPTTTLSLTKGQSGTISITTLNWYFFTSTAPVIGSAQQNGADKTILSPAKLTSYHRYLAYYITSINTTPSNVGAYVISDTTYPVISHSIADGSGGDSAQGLAYEYLCDSYSWGNVLSDYTIVAPYPNTIVNTYYWSGTAWIIWDSHILLTGAMLSPTQVIRDGTTGTGVTGTIISGLANNMAAGATLWKWEGNFPFYLCINDSYDDELSLLGWMNIRKNRTVSDLDTNWYDISGLSNNATLINGPIYNSGFLTFDGVDDQVVVPHNAVTMDFSLGQSICMWIKPTTGSESIRRNPYNQAYGGPGTLTHETDRTINYYFGTNGGNASPYVGRSSVFTVNTNELAFICVTRNQATNVCNWYKNGVLITTYDAGGYAATANGTADIIIGGGYTSNFLGNIYQVSVYNRALSATEIKQNFNSMRFRFGL